MFHHIAWAMKAQTPDALSKWLLVILADHADASGMCFPSQSTLANRTGMSRTTVNRKMLLLENAELITRTSGHEGKSTRYYLHVSEGDIPVSERHNPVSQGHTKLPVNYINNIEEWQLSDEVTQQINSTNQGVIINHELEADKFKDYVRASGKKYKDFNAAYRNWCRNANRFSATNGNSKTARVNTIPNNKQSGEILRAISGLGHSSN